MDGGFVLSRAELKKITGGNGNEQCGVQAGGASVLEDYVAVSMATAVILKNIVERAAKAAHVAEIIMQKEEHVWVQMALGPMRYRCLLVCVRLT